jgi:hypothetical protein
LYNKIWCSNLKAASMFCFNGADFPTLTRVMMQRFNFLFW